MSRRRLGLLTVLCTVLLAAWFGTRAWQRSRNERMFREALAKLNRGNMEGVRAVIQALESEAEFASHARLLRAVRLAHGGDAQTALYELSAVRAEGELREPALLLKGKCFYRLRRLAEAERTFRILALEQPDLPAAHRWLVTIYHEMGAMKAALAELEHVVRLQPEDFFAYRLMGLIYKEDLDNFQAAIDRYRQALDRNPPPDQRQAILRELAESLVNQQQYTKALDALQDADDDAQVFALKADCYWRQGDHDRARQMLRRANELDPDQRTALLLQARIDLQVRNPAAAAKTLQQILQRDPHNYQARYQLVQAYLRLGRTEDAQWHLERMKNSRDLQLQLADLYHEAIYEPNNAAIRDQIAELCRRLDKHELAEIWQRGANTVRRIQSQTPSLRSPVQAARQSP